MLRIMERDEQNARWAQWMAKAQDGDGAAYGALLADILPVIRRMVGRRWNRPEGAEDVVQEVLLSVHQVRHTFDPARPFLPWLTAIVAHRVADAMRREYRRDGRERNIDDQPETFFATETNTDVMDMKAVRRAMAQLPEGQRQAIELVKLRDMSLAEASAATGMTPGALKVAVHRALKTLKGLLAKDEP